MSISFESGATRYPFVLYLAVDRAFATLHRRQPDRVIGRPDGAQIAVEPIKNGHTERRFVDRLLGFDERLNADFLEEYPLGLRTSLDRPVVAPDPVSAPTLS
jgi:hypothetical protein